MYDQASDSVGSTQVSPWVYFCFRKVRFCSSTTITRSKYVLEHISGRFSPTLPQEIVLQGFSDAMMPEKRPSSWHRRVSRLPFFALRSLSKMIAITFQKHLRRVQKKRDFYPPHFQKIKSSTTGTRPHLPGPWDGPGKLSFGTIKRKRGSSQSKKSKTKQTFVWSTSHPDACVAH